MRRRILLSGGVSIDPTAGRRTIGDYEVVDLGLPSGLLWATWNVGATEETDYGNLYMYGKGSRKYNESDSMYEGTEDPLASTADTATQVMGSEWRMPTEDELYELTANTKYEWVTDFNGSRINGCLFISKANPKAYVFFPAAGARYNGINPSFRDDFYVWSSTPFYSKRAFILTINYRGVKELSDYDRDHGYSVRGVHAAV